jgi:hypothetical protein
MVPVVGFTNTCAISALVVINPIPYDHDDKGSTIIKRKFKLVMHVYPWTVVSVLSNNKNTTKPVGIIQNRHHLIKM